MLVRRNFESLLDFAEFAAILVFRCAHVAHEVRVRSHANILSQNSRSQLLARIWSMVKFAGEWAAEWVGLLTVSTFSTNLSALILPVSYSLYRLNREFCIAICSHSSKQFRLGL